MKRFLSLALLFIVSLDSFAQDEEAPFTIYLVRHAEKDVSGDYPKDPPLTPCGIQRAEKLAEFLELADIKAIYSSDYRRTKDTAQPAAIAKNLEINLYDPRQLEDMAKLLIERKEDALVIGHSNTTPVLAGLLVGEKLDPFDETIYNRIYQVVLSKKGGRLHVLQSSFQCHP